MDWSSTSSTVIITGSVLGALTTIVGTGAALWVKVIRPAKKKLEEMNAKLSIIPSMQAKLDEVYKEVKPNSGGSIKDQVQQALILTKTVAAVQRANTYMDERPAFHCDASGEVTSITAGYTRLTGLELASVKREGWKMAIHPDDLLGVVRMWHEALRTGTIFVHEFKYINRARRSVVSCRVVAEPITVDNVPGVQGWIGRIEELAQADLEPDDVALQAIDRALTRSSHVESRRRNSHQLSGHYRPDADPPGASSEGEKPDVPAKGDD